MIRCLFGCLFLVASACQVDRPDTMEQACDDLAAATCAHDARCDADPLSDSPKVWTGADKSICKTTVKLSCCSDTLPDVPSCSDPTNDEISADEWNDCLHDLRALDCTATLAPDSCTHF